MRPRSIDKRAVQQWAARFLLCDELAQAIKDKNGGALLLMYQTSFTDTHKVGYGLFALLVYPLAFMFLFGVKRAEHVPAEAQIYTSMFALIMVGFGLLIARTMLGPVPESEFAKPNNQPQIARIPKKQFVILGGLILSLTHFIAFKGIAEHILTYVDARTVMMERPILGVSQNTWNNGRGRKDHIYSTYILGTQSALGKPYDVVHVRHRSAKSWTIADGACLFLTLRRGWRNVAAVQSLRTGQCLSDWQDSAGFKITNYDAMRLKFRAVLFNKGLGFPEQPNPYCIVPKGQSICEIAVFSAP
jgi:hypothetical protein